MKRKILSVLVSAMMVTGLMSASLVASAEEDGDVSGELTLIHYLTEDAKLEALDNLVNGFMEEYPNVTVSTESVSMDNYTDVIKLRLSSGDAPDILFGGPSSYPELIEAGYIMDLTDEDFVSRVADGCRDLMTVDGVVYGVPLDQMANVVFYNKDIFDEVGLSIPTTYSEFIETCQALEDAGYYGCAAGYTDDISIGANFYTIFYGAPYQECPNITDELENQGADWGDYPSFSRAAEEFKEIIPYQNPDSASISTDRAEQLFANGESGMIIIGTWGLGAIMNYNPDLNCGGFIYPSEETAEDNAIPLNTDDSWMIYKDTENLEAAEAFFEYMTRPDVNADWIGIVGQLSALDGIEADQLPQGAAEVADLINGGCPVSMYTQYGAWSGQYSDVFYNSLQDFAMTEDMTVDDLIAELNDGFASANK